MDGTKLELLELYRIYVNEKDQKKKQYIKNVIDNTERRIKNWEKVATDIYLEASKYVTFYKDSEDEE